MWNRLRTGLFSQKEPALPRRRAHGGQERAHDIVEEGLDKLVEGDTETGEQLIDKVKQIDPKAVEELAEEVTRHNENAERFVNKG